MQMEELNTLTLLTNLTKSYWESDEHGFLVKEILYIYTILQLLRGHYLLQVADQTNHLKTFLPVKCGGTRVEQSWQQRLSVTSISGSLQFDKDVIFIMDAQWFTSLTQIIIHTVAVTQIQHKIVTDCCPTKSPMIHSLSHNTVQGNMHVMQKPLYIDITSLL